MICPPRLFAFSLPHAREMPPRKTGKQPTTEEGLLEQYSTVLDQVTRQPYNRDLHLEHVQLTKQLKDAAGLEAAREMMATYYPLPTGRPE